MFFPIVKTLHHKTCEVICAIRIRGCLDTVDIKPLTKDEFDPFDARTHKSVYLAWWRVERALTEPTNLYFDTKDLSPIVEKNFEEWVNDNSFIRQSPLSIENIRHFNLEKFDIGEIQ
jgi:hypothetical protein